MATPIGPVQTTNSAQAHEAAPSFGQRVLAFWRKMTCTDASAVAERNRVESRALRASTHNSASVLTAIQSTTTVEETNLTPVQRALEKWVKTAPTHDEQVVRQDVADSILKTHPILQEDGTLQVSGDLHLGGTTGLTGLPDKLNVDGHLILFCCIHLEGLPNNLQVGGNLVLLGCISLESLPDNLRIGGKLHLRRCINLRTVPQAIFNQGLNADGQIREIYLQETGLSDEAIRTAARSWQSQYPDIRFVLKAGVLTYLPNLRWQDLKTAQHVDLNDESICAITLLPWHELEQPVYVPYVATSNHQQDGQGHIFEFRYLLEWHDHHPANPINPMTRAPLNLSQLQRIVVPQKSLMNAVDD